MVVREMIATARERIAKLREAEKMVGARGGGSASKEPEAQHIERGSRHGGSVGFATWLLHLGVRFAPFILGLLWYDSVSGF